MPPTSIADHPALRAIVMLLQCGLAALVGFGLFALVTDGGPTPTELGSTSAALTACVILVLLTATGTVRTLSSCAFSLATLAAWTGVLLEPGAATPMPKLLLALAGLLLVTGLATASGRDLPGLVWAPLAVAVTIGTFWAGFAVTAAVRGWEEWAMDFDTWWLQLGLVARAKTEQALPGHVTMLVAALLVAYAALGRYPRALATVSVLAGLALGAHAAISYADLSF